MHTLIAKYVNAYQSAHGSATDKVKKVLMIHAHVWEWEGSSTLVADLIDDVNITAHDIVDFLADSYEHEGGNQEFHYAMRALQICLRKADLADASLHKNDIFKEFGGEDTFDYESQDIIPRNFDGIHHFKY